MTDAAATKEEAAQNNLLSSIRADELERLLPNLQLLSLPLGKVLYESGEKMDYIYFPTTAIISLLYIMENGSSAEIGVVGNDGMIGIAIFMGGDTTPNRAVVQSAGKAFKMKSSQMKDEFTLGGRFHNICLRYTQALITQISQTAVCNRLHSVDQQLCRWLLLSHDRLPTDRLIMTQDLISNMLGVRREGITHAAKRLQSAGYISYVRGDMTILNRKGLEASVCECYQVVKTEYDRLLA
ncbi:MAG: Crp/Fnr family transcriptional regulator [Acidobacteriota bacterium]